MNKEEVGKFIKQLREENNMTQDDLAEKLYCSRANISHIELGRVEISYDKVLLLTELFDVSELEIYSGKRLENLTIIEGENILNHVVRILTSKFKRNLILCISIFILLILCFLGYYFLNSYNSVKVYNVYGESENFRTTEGLFVLTKENIYFNLNIIPNSNSELTSMSLYYKKDGKETKIYDIDSSEIFLVDFYGYEAYFSYDDLISGQGTFYLELIFDEQEETIILDVQKMYENKKLFFKKNKRVANSKPINTTVPNIPPKIKETFKLEKDVYTYNITNNDVYIAITYIPLDNNLVVGEEYSEYTNTWSYNLKDKCIEYSYFDKNGNVEQKSLNSDSTNKEEQKLYNYFKDNYIYKYLE